jgi:hypothetical protein
MGSFAPRVRVFLAAVAPDLDLANSQAKVAIADRPAPNVNFPLGGDLLGANGTYPSDSWSPSAEWSPPNARNRNQDPTNHLAGEPRLVSTMKPSQGNESQALGWSDVSRAGWYEALKTTLAAIGLAAIALRLVKFVR